MGCCAAQGRTKLIMREGRCLRSQKLKSPILMYRLCREQTTAHGNQRQRYAGGSHKIKQAVDTEA